MKLLFLTDNYPPEVNAPATRTYEHCAEWVKKGIDVTVITCFPNFPQGKVYKGYTNKLIQKETIDGIKIIRVWSFISPNQGFFRRSLDYFSFAVSAFLVGLSVKTDLIVATSPQFFTAGSGSWLSFFKRKPWVMEVRDLWPASIKKVGAVDSGILLKFFYWWEKRLYISSKHIVVVTHSFKKEISSKGINPKKISVVTNGANLILYKCRPKNHNIIDQMRLNNKTIISYIGTHGMAHKIDFILHCVKKINNPDFHFLFIGTGAERVNLVKLKVELKLHNVTFLGPVEKQDVPEYLSITDISLITLSKADIFRTVIPSKIFESAAMQIPILLGVDGESRQIIEEFNAGLFFEPENENDFLEKLYILSSNKELYNSCKDGSKKLAEAFERNKLAIKMLDILNSSI